MLISILIAFQLMYMTIPTQVWTLTPPPPPPSVTMKQVAQPSSIDAAQFAPNPVSRFIKIFMIVVGAAVVASNFAASMRLWKNLNLFFRVFLILVPLSLLWSISRVDTFNRYLSILSELLIALAFCVSGWHARRFQNTLRVVTTVLLLGSLLLGMTIPDLAIEHGIGTLKDAWHGLTAQKNEFGQLAGFGALLWLHGLMTKQVRAWIALPLGAVSYYCVLLSRSSTSLMATLFASLFMLIALSSSGGMKRYIPYFVGGLAVAVLTYALAVLNIIPGTSILLEPLAAMIGKDMTFSARSFIWDIIKDHIKLSPVLGSGYGAYWIGPIPTSPSYVFMWKMYFYPTESHNGYLEIVNDLGYVGLFCLVGFLYQYIRQSLLLLRIDRAQAFLFLSFFFLEAIVNLSESTWLVINSGFIFFVMTLAVVCLGRALMEQPQPVPRQERSKAGARSTRAFPTKPLRPGARALHDGRPSNS